MTDVVNVKFIYAAHFEAKRQTKCLTELLTGIYMKH